MQVLIENCQENKEQWLKAREGKITATMAYDAADIDEGSSPMNAWLGLRGEREPFHGNESTEIGLLLEDDVAELFCRRYIEDNPGADVKLNKFDVFGVHDKYDFLGSSFDWEVIINGERSLLETKTTRARFLPQWEDGNVPNRYRAQLLHELAVDGAARRAYIAALVFEPTLKYSYIDREEELVDELVQRELRLYELFKQGTPPDLKNPTQEHLKALFWETDESEIILEPRHQEIIASYKSACDQEKQAKERKAKCQADLLQLCGKAKRARCGDYKVSIVRTEYQNFDTARWKKEDPTQYESLRGQYGKPVSYMYARISENNKENKR